MHVIEVETNAGTFTIELYRLHAPKTCYNFLELVKIGQLLISTCSINVLCPKLFCLGYYNDTVFHRVIRDFVRMKTAASISLKGMI